MEDLILSVCVSVCPSALSQQNRLTYDFSLRAPTDRWTGRRYQVHYLPASLKIRYAVYKNEADFWNPTSHTIILTHVRIPESGFLHLSGFRIQDVGEFITLLDCYFLLILHPVWAVSRWIRPSLRPFSLSYKNFIQLLLRHGILSEQARSREVTHLSVNSFVANVFNVEESIRQ